MKKSMLLWITFTMLSFTGFGQTTATDITSNDCAGTSQNLFTELDAGKVVVLVWVMPCGSCTGPAKTAYNIVQSYATSNPGKVLYWLIDENNNCIGMNNWASTNSVSTNAVKFSNSAIAQTPYGSPGMPKVVVVGKTSHKIYFNKNNSASGNSTEIQAAIDSALAIPAPPTGIKEKSSDNLELNLFPNPVSNTVNISYSLPAIATVNMEIYNLIGEKVRSIVSERLIAGEHQQTINLESLQNGVYYLKLDTGNDSGIIKFTVAH